MPMYHVRHLESNDDVEPSTDVPAENVIYLVSFLGAVQLREQENWVVDTTGTGSNVPAINRNVDYDNGDVFHDGTTHRTTLKSCSCQFPTCWGLPCHHMFSVAHHICWDKVRTSIDV
jgi:hypothetical protein